MVDFFDNNSVGSDSHLQFTNWAIDNNGAYDYAANTRGYTDRRDSQLCRTEIRSALSAKH